MKIRIYGRLAHHALKGALLLAVPALLASDIRGRSLLMNIAGVALPVLALSLAVLALGHGGDCNACRRKSPEILNRPLYRAWAKFSRWGIIPLLVTGVLAVLLVPLIFSAGAHREREFDWGATGALAVVTMTAGLCLSAARFRRVNHPGLTPYTPVRTFLEGPGRRIRHKGHWIVLALFPVCVIAAFQSPEGVWGFAGGLAFIALFGASYAEIQHDLALCEQCVVEFRTDAIDYAARRKWRFAVMHRGSWIPTAGVLVMIVGGSIVEDDKSPYLLAGNFAISACFVLLGRFHGAYQPWCPYCRGGGGGGEEEEVVPDPSGGHGRPVPVA